MDTELYLLDFCILTNLSTTWDISSETPDEKRLKQETVSICSTEILWVLLMVIKSSSKNKKHIFILLNTYCKKFTKYPVVIFF